MGIRLRSSRQTLDILEALLALPSQWHHGYAISRQTGVPSGTLYPILMRLDKLGWLETKWEETIPQGRPPRHLYRLTGNGREWAREELRSAEQREFWKPAASQA
jgi:PadR family transcriptional regulator, regulatory protein PadR